MWLVVLALLWVLAATVVAFLPMRRQYAPGILLVLAAPVLIGLLFWYFGPIYGLAGLLAFLSMFRKPLGYFARRAIGAPTDRPETNGDAS